MFLTKRLRFALAPGDEETVVSACPVLHAGLGTQFAALHRADEGSLPTVWAFTTAAHLQQQKLVWQT